MPQSPVAQSDWLNEFHSFTLYHLVMMIIFVAIIAAACLTGKFLLRRDLLRSTLTEQRFRRMLAWSIIVSQAFFFSRRLTPEHWDIQDSLPMHLCRWAVWVAAWALLTLNGRARALLLFWGIALSSQALVSPMITDGANSWAFWIYWINHIQIVGAAIYDIVVLGYRPNRKDLYTGMFWGTAYGIFAVGVNAALGTNYTYLGKGAHDAPSLVDQLGPYPLRTVWMILGGNLLCVILYIGSRGMLLIRTGIFKKPQPRMFEASDFQPPLYSLDSKHAKPPPEKDTEKDTPES